VSAVAEFNFSQATAFSIGGTIGGANPLTYTGGSAVSSIVKSLSFKGDNALATERFGLGNAGVKKEQLENGIPTITGTLEAEYLQSEWYTPFKANTSTSLNVKFEGAVIGSSSDKDTIEFIVPQIRIKNVSPQVSGPDLVTATVEFEVYSDGTNNPFQAKIISGDSTRRSDGRRGGVHREGGRGLRQQPEPDPGADRRQRRRWTPRRRRWRATPAPTRKMGQTTGDAAAVWSS
jgi:hypothetical protein